MAKRTKQGVGMTERVVIQHDQSDFSDAGSFAEVFFASLDANCIATNVRAENAERCQNILSAAGLVLGKIESERLLGKYGEDSPERLAADWLRSYMRMGALSEKALNGDTMALTDLIGEAEHLGIIQERMWWRCGLDHSTGKKRESLAVKGKENSLHLKDAAAKTNAIHSPLRTRRFARIKEILADNGILENACFVCEVEGLGKAGAIKRQWNRFK
jgi:hypothetical protein